jgi:Transposase
VTERPLVWVGIDVGKSAHHACGIDPEGTVVFSQGLANDQAAIEALVARASQTASEVRWAIDLTSSAAALLAAVLVATEGQVVYVPGRVRQPASASTWRRSTAWPASRTPARRRGKDSGRVTGNLRRDLDSQDAHVRGADRRPGPGPARAASVSNVAETDGTAEARIRHATLTAVAGLS